MVVWKEASLPSTLHVRIPRGAVLRYLFQWEDIAQMVSSRTAKML